jgi:hypothetical protein
MPSLVLKEYFYKLLLTTRLSIGSFLIQYRPVVILIVLVARRDNVDHAEPSLAFPHDSGVLVLIRVIGNTDTDKSHPLVPGQH